MKLVRLLLESSEITVYVDMDGVLCDFDRQVIDLGIKRDSSFWPSIDGYGEKYWSSMKWMPDGKTLWSVVKNHKPIILSTPSKHPSSIVGKVNWIKRNLGTVPHIFEKHKEKYARPNAVLIDDRVDNISDWKNAGGIGIHHISASDTTKQLRNLGIA